jgi:hypothetical protein
MGQGGWSNGHRRDTSPGVKEMNLGRKVERMALNSIQNMPKTVECFDPASNFLEYMRTSRVQPLDEMNMR